MADRMTLPPTPPGLQDQRYRGGPGDDGLQPIAGPPRQPNPIGRPTAVVGGPAYFTPEGYQAPMQPTQAFMPTDRMPDPIGDQFRRQSQSPMGQQYQEQYQATQAPIRAAEAAKRAEEQAAQDARFQEQMDRIAELEGQLATPAGPAPVEDPVIPPGAYPPYIPGVTPFPGIGGIPDYDFSGLPDFMGDIDFSGIPGYSGVPEPEYGRGPGPAPQYGYEDVAPPENNFFIDGDGNLNVGDLMGPHTSPAPEPEFTPPPTMPEPNAFFPDSIINDKSKLRDSGRIRTPKPYTPQSPPMMPAPTMPAPQVVNNYTALDPDRALSVYGQRQQDAPAPAPASVYTPPPSRIPMQDTFEDYDDYDYGNPNLRNRGMFGPGI